MSERLTSAANVRLTLKLRGERCGNVSKLNMTFINVFLNVCIDNIAMEMLHNVCRYMYNRAFS